MATSNADLIALKDAAVAACAAVVASWQSGDLAGAANDCAEATAEAELYDAASEDDSVSDVREYEAKLAGNPRGVRFERLLQGDPDADGSDGGDHERYALVTYSERYGRRYVTTHASTDAALKAAGHAIVEDTDGWYPQELWDLDEGRALVADAAFDVTVDVTLGAGTSSEPR